MANETLKRHLQGNENSQGCTKLTAVAWRQQRQHFPDKHAAKVVCECSKTRNMCKALLNASSEEQIFKSKRKKTTYRQAIPNNGTINDSESKYCKGTTAPSKLTPLVAATPTTTSMLACNNFLHNLVGSLLWHITASTAISILATLYYFIGNTEGASAISVVASMPTSLSSSLLASLLMYSSLASATAAMPTQTPSSVPTLLLITTNYSFLPTISPDNIAMNSNSSSSNNGVMDFNYNYRINSTEITILNGISSLATNKLSVDNGIDNNNNNNSNINTNNSNNNVITVYYNNNAISLNDTMDDLSAEDASEYIFDRTDVRIIFITLYTIVFCCCFFGNLLVILVVTLSRRLRSITNFFLANLALADFCVGLFCVMQNLSIYLIDSWVFGEFLCRMYQFVHSLSYTASIFILVVICMERYFAIVHPITCKQILTAARLRMVILTVWITSAVYSTPKFVFSKTIKNVHTESGREEEICVLDRKMFNSKLLDMINFGLLYVIPLLVMTVLYSKIAIALWRSSRGLQHHLAQQGNGMGMHNSMYHHHQHHHHNHNHNHHNQHHLHNHLQQQQQQQLSASLGTPISVNSSVVSAATTLSRKQSFKYDAKRSGVNLTDSQHDSYKVSLEEDRPVVSACRKTSFYHNHHQQQQQQPTAVNHHRQLSQHSHHGLHGSQRVSHISHSSNNVLRARRGVVRMLIIFVLTFALCNLPYHARKMWQYWSRSYRGDSNFNALLTPLTFLVTYFNSGINPLLYAFLSRNFRKGMKELLMCSWRKSKTKSSTNSSMHHKRVTLQTHSIPTDTTHIGNDQL